MRLRLVALVFAAAAIAATAAGIPSPETLQAEIRSREGIDELLRGRHLEARELLDQALAARASSWDRYARARARLRSGDVAGACADLETLGSVPAFRPVALAWLERLLPSGRQFEAPPLRLVSAITDGPAGAVAPLGHGKLLFAPLAGTGILRANQTDPPEVFAAGFEAITQILRLSTGEIAVADFAAGRVVILSPTGWRRASFPAEGLLGPSGIAQAMGTDSQTIDLLVSVGGTGEVVRFRRLRGGDFARVASYFSEAPLARPRGLLALEDGGFLVAEAGRARVLRVDAEGNVLGTLTHPRLREPTDFSRAAGGTGEGIWIADADPAGGGLFWSDTHGARPRPMPGAETETLSVYADPNGTIFLASSRGLYGYRSDPPRTAWVEITGVSARRYPEIELRAVVRDPAGRPIWGLTERNLRVLGPRNEVRRRLAIVPPRIEDRKLRLVWADPDPAFLDEPLRRTLAAWRAAPEGETRIGGDLARLERVIAELAPRSDPAAILLLAGYAHAPAETIERLAASARANGIAIFVLATGPADGPERAGLLRLAEESGGLLASPFEGAATLPLERALASYYGGRYRIYFTIPPHETHLSRELVPVTLEARYRGLAGFDRLAIRVPVR